MSRDKFVMVNLQEDKAKKLAKVITNDTCLKILDYLSDKDATESELAEKLGQPLSTIHYNIAQLVDGGLVVVDEFHYSPKGKEVNHYKLAHKYIIIAPKETKGLRSKLRSILPASLVALAAAGIIGFGNKLFPSSGILSKTASAPAAEYARSAAASAADAVVQQNMQQAAVAATQAAQQAMTNAAVEAAKTTASTAMNSVMQDAAQEGARMASASSAASAPIVQSASQSSAQEIANAATTAIQQSTQQVANSASTAASTAMQQSANQASAAASKAAEAVIQQSHGLHPVVWFLIGAVVVIAVILVIEFFTREK